MKVLTIEIDPCSNEATVIDSVSRKLQGAGAISGNDSVLLQEARACIRDLITKAGKQYASGTTVDISKEFQFSCLRLYVRLSHPRKCSLLEKLIDVFRGR